MPVQLTPEQTEFIASQIETGRYATIEDVITAALQSLADEQVQDEMDRQTLSDDLQRIQNFRETGRGVHHEQVAAWLTSIGSENELPCPNGN